jgi:hypothetical protein
VNVDEDKGALEVDDRSMQNVEDWGHRRCDLWTSDVDRYKCDDGNDADTDEEEEALLADNGSMQNVEDWEYSTWECEDWTVYFAHVKYNNCKANGTASDIFKVKNVFEYVTKSQS